MNKSAFNILLILLIPIFSCSQEIIADKYRFGEGIRFTSNNGNLFGIRGFIQPSLEIKGYSDTISEGPFERFRLRRLRFEIFGAFKAEKINYRLKMDFSGISEVGDQTNNYLLDAFISYNFTKRLKILFGQRSTPTDNRELWMGSQATQFVERSRVTSAFSSIREFGLFIYGDIRFRNSSYLKNVLTITNGDGKNILDKDFGGLKIGGRIDYLPFGLFTYFGQFRQIDIIRENSPKFIFGTYYSYNNGISSRRGREGGSILYMDNQNNILLPNYVKWGVDFLFKYKGISILGEYVNAFSTVPNEISQRVRNDGSIASTFTVNSINVSVEDYINNRMMVGSGFNIQVGYFNKKLWSFDARYTHLRSKEFSFLNNGLYYNRPNYYTVGISKFLNKNYGFKIQASITYNEINENSRDINNNFISGNEWITRIMTTVTF